MTTSPIPSTTAPRPIARAVHPRRGLPPAARVALVVYLACLAWMPRVLERLDPLTGDEPFYVMTGISLVDDRDLDEVNNYAQRDYARFYPTSDANHAGWPGYPDPLPPHASNTERDGLYSKHGLGMAALVAVPFALGGRPLVLVLLALIAAAVAANTTLLAAHYAPTPIAAAIALALALTTPLAAFSLLIFPEVTAALCVTYAVRRLLLPANRPWQWLLIGGAAAALPWLHYRLAVVSVALAVIAIWRHGRALRGRSGLAAAFLPIVGAVVLFAWYTHLYGRPLPPASDHKGFSDLPGTLNGLAGTFLDQQWGAVVHNPLLLLAAATALPFVRARRRDALALAVVFVPYLLLIGSYSDWWGEWCPPARYLTAVVPLSAAPLAWWLARLRRPVLPWLTLLAFALPALLVMATFAADPQRMYNHPDGTSNLLVAWSRFVPVHLQAHVPSFVPYSLSSVADRRLAVLLFLLALALLALAAQRLLPTSEHRRATPHPGEP